jgi:hypothetical protein
MSRNLDRTLVVSSILAAIGSFLIDLGEVTNKVAPFVAWKLRMISAADKDFVVTALVAIIVSAAVGLAVIKLARTRRGR